MRVSLMEKFLGNISLLSYLEIWGIKCIFRICSDHFISNPRPGSGFG